MKFAVRDCETATRSFHGIFYEIGSQTAVTSHDSIGDDPGVKAYFIFAEFPQNIDICAVFGSIAKQVWSAKVIIRDCILGLFDYFACVLLIDE